MIQVWKQNQDIKDTICISDLEFRKSLDGLQRSEDTQHSQRFDGLNVPSFVVSGQKDRQCEHHTIAAYSSKYHILIYFSPPYSSIVTLCLIWHILLMLHSEFCSFKVFLLREEDFLVFYPSTLLLVNPTGASPTDGEEQERGTRILTVIELETKWRRWLHEEKQHLQQK